MNNMPDMFASDDPWILAPILLLDEEFDDDLINDLGMASYVTYDKTGKLINWS